MKLKHLLIAATLTLASTNVTAELRNDIPSCYSILKNDVTVSPPERELIVLIDQTLLAPNKLKLRVHEQVHRFLKPGDWITIANFSAYVKDSYTTIGFSGYIEPPIDKDIRYNTSKKSLRSFDNCISQQTNFYRGSIDKHLKSSFGQHNQEIPNTELVGNLKLLSEALIEQTQAKRKVILLFSDMLENSETSSFYSKSSVRLIDPSLELNKFNDTGLLTNYGNADIYVMGAGLTKSTNYKSEVKLRRIRSFWEQYFKQSNGRLSGWGQPDLLGSIK